MAVANGNDKIRTADTRKYIEIVIGEELKGSPLEGQEALYVKYGDEFKVDPLLAIAIAFHESHYCSDYADWHNRDYHNCAGIMNGGEENGLVRFASYEDFIRTHIELLSKYVYGDNRDSVSKIGSKYAPTKYSFINQSWVGSVSKKYFALWAIVDSK